MTFQFLDVGMGDGSLVIIGNKPSEQELVLIDLGIQPFVKFKEGVKDALVYLVDTIDTISSARGKDDPYLDHLFITHPDPDHYNRVMTLIESKYKSYPGKKLKIGGFSYGGAKSLYKGTIKKISDQVEDKVDTLTDNQCSIINADGSVKPKWEFSDAEISVYLLNVNYPDKKSAVKNPLSLCLMFADEFNNKVIFMGDAEWTVEDQIVENFKSAKPANFLKAYALKLGHHGSEAGTSEEWLKVVQPKAVFASGDVKWAHPYCNTVDRVIKTVKLNKTGKHWYSCGEAFGKDDRRYFNHEAELDVFLNLWYIVKSPFGEWLQEEGKPAEFSLEGMTYGVQYSLTFNGAAAPTILVSDKYQPVKPPKK